MYTPNTLTLYVRAPIWASSLRRLWPYRGGVCRLSRRCELRLDGVYPV